MAKVDIKFEPKQQLAYNILTTVESTIRILGFGGARGGGKSYFARTFQILRRLEYPNSDGLIVRRTLKELEKNHIRKIKKEWPDTIYKFNEQKFQFQFKNGSVLDLMYVDGEKDLEKLQGAEYDDICIDEAEHHDKIVMQKLRGSLRTTRKDIKTTMLVTFNWGNVGHKWLKKMFWRESFRENATEEQKKDVWDTEWHWQTGETPSEYYFIQAFYYDNPHLNKEYKNDLDALPETLRKAWRDGDPDVFEGQFFPEFGPHLRERPYVIPAHKCNLYGSLDYGEGAGEDAGATSFGLWHIDDKGKPHRLFTYYKRHQTASTYVREIIAACMSFHYTSGRLPKIIFADPSMWIKRRMDDNFSLSVADVFMQYLSPMHIKLEKANNNRVQGWRVVRQYFTCGEDGTPNSYYWEGYNQEYEDYVPALVHAKHNVEDVAKKGDDHCGDETRYMMVAAMTLGQLAQDESNYDPYAKIEQFNKINNICNLAMARSGHYDTGWR